MYDGLVTDYPFDHHQAFLELYFLPANREGGKDKQKPIEAGPAKPAKAAATPTPEGKPAEKKDEAEPKKTEAAAHAKMTSLSALTSWARYMGSGSMPPRVMRAPTIMSE
jgi:hypothetical protein